MISDKAVEAAALAKIAFLTAADFQMKRLNRFAEEPPKDTWAKSEWLRDHWEAVAKAVLQAALPVLLEGKEPVGWLHTMHTEGDQTITRLSKSPDPPFGVPGVDYSDTFRVTTEPLYTASGITGESDER